MLFKQKKEDLKKLFNLKKYHTSYLEQASHNIDFTGKRVLEVGGSLPKELTIDTMKD
jgi:hypothetical protein